MIVLLATPRVQLLHVKGRASPAVTGQRCKKPDIWRVLPQLQAQVHTQMSGAPIIPGAGAPPSLSATFGEM